MSEFLFSCLSNENLNLNHHFSNKRSYDQTYHFFRCLDEGCDAVREKRTHFLADGVCEVCGYDVKWDNLNGGGEGEEIQEISKISESDYIIDDFYYRNVVKIKTGCYARENRNSFLRFKKPHVIIK